MRKFMKTTKILFGILTITAAFGINGHSQIYQFSTPISGYLTMSAADLNGPTGSSGTINLNFNSLTETIYLDPVAGTIRQVGAISATPSAPNIQFQETQSVPGQFPNPPTNVSGIVTVNLAPTGGILSFDTGPQSVTWDAALSAYTVDAVIFAQGLPMSGSYSIVTGGQTNTGSFSYTLDYWFGGDVAFTFDAFSLTDYPSSLQLNGLGYNYGSAPFLSPGIVADVTSSNGFEMKLSTGINGISIFGNVGELYLWSSDPVTATNIASGPAAITSEPNFVLAHAQDAVSFSVTASGTVPLSYQWSLNGTNILGATANTLTIAHVGQSDLGSYVVVVTNAFGMDISSNATLSMYPFIAAPFTGATTSWGKATTLSVGAWGTGPLSYQWFKDGLAIQNETNQTLSLPNIQFTNAGLYSVVVKSALGSATNTPAQLIVNAAGVSLGFCPALTISGVVGYSYIIQSSTNLTDTNAWNTLANLPLTQPVQLWVDTNVDASSPFNSKTFYRVLPGQ
jgi:hypothetical protein